MRKFIYLVLVFTTFMGLFNSCKARPKEASGPYRVKLETTGGVIVVRLYDETPAHRDNFIKLAQEGFYEGTLFHRVIKDFMIQAGDPLSKKAKRETSLGTGDVGYTLPAEFVYPRYYHKRGALAAARQGDSVNPERRSSGCQFYLVIGRPFSEAELEAMERQRFQRKELELFQSKASDYQDEIKKYRLSGEREKLDQLRDTILADVHRELETTQAYRFTPEQRKGYLTLGGTPHLDGEYSVFGEVEEGLDVVMKISETPTDPQDRPSEDIKILRVEVLN